MTSLCELYRTLDLPGASPLTYDRLFAGIRFDELDGNILFVYAKSEGSADEIEDKFSMHIPVIASKILDREVNIVMVLPRQLVH